MVKLRNVHVPHANALEMERRVEFTVKLFREFKYKGEIRRRLNDEYGIEWNMADRYIARARARILNDAGESKGQYAALLTDKLMEIIGSDTTVANKIRAIEVAAKMLGLNMLQVNQTVTLTTEDLDVRRSRIVEQLNRLRSQQLIVDGEFESSLGSQLALESLALESKPLGEDGPPNGEEQLSEHPV